eukprot:GEMP01125730.1.p1 GENE.GEMP01125730.1~~GEMP01125730.1.p1  ORF type:complete len:107 (-),score=7.50 GEMP01125730.1:239-559(-)
MLGGEKMAPWLPRDDCEERISGATPFVKNTIFLLFLNEPPNVFAEARFGRSFFAHYLIKTYKRLKKRCGNPIYNMRAWREQDHIHVCEFSIFRSFNEKHTMKNSIE